MKIRLAMLTVLLLLTSLSLGSAQITTPAFTQYAARVENIKNVRVNLRSHREANRFRTNLRNAAKEGVNFAGRYILTTWGCGTNCMVGAIIDGRTGKVFFPDELSGMSFGFCDLPDDTEPVVYKADSRLLILSGFKGGGSNVGDGRCGVYYLEWTGTKFKQIQFVEKKRREAP